MCRFVRCVVEWWSAFVMHEPLSRSRIAAINAGGKSAVEICAERIRANAETSDGKLAVEDRGWFSDAARGLHSTKAGTALHFTTGVDERLCQRYASGETKPGAYFLRTLLRSDQGRQWLNAVMDGSDVEWWREHQRAERIAEQIDRLDLR